MNIVSSANKLFRFSGSFLSMLGELLFSSDTQENDDRRLHDSDISGELNHRTGKIDAGTDPYGWYED